MFGCVFINVYQNFHFHRNFYISVLNLKLNALLI